MILNPVIIGAVVAQSLITKGSKIAGAISGYVLTTGILIWGIFVYADGNQIALLGIPFSQTVFIIACLLWYGIDTIEFIVATKSSKLESGLTPVQQQVYSEFKEMEKHKEKNRSAQDMLIQLSQKHNVSFEYTVNTVAKGGKLESQFFKKPKSEHSIEPSNNHVESKLLDKAGNKLNTQFFINTYKAYTSGVLSKYYDILGTRKLMLQEFVEVYQEESGKDISKITEKYPPEKDEFLVCFFANQLMLTNQRLFIYSEPLTSGLAPAEIKIYSEYKELTKLNDKSRSEHDIITILSQKYHLALEYVTKAIAKGKNLEYPTIIELKLSEISSYNLIQKKRGKLFSIVIKLKSGETCEFKDYNNIPSEEYFNTIIRIFT